MHRSAAQTRVWRRATQAGDRGGGLQFAVFGLIIVGLAVVFTVVFRNVIRRDRERAARVE